MTTRHSALPIYFSPLPRQRISITWQSVSGATAVECQQPTCDVRTEPPYQTKELALSPFLRYSIEEEANNYDPQHSLGGRQHSRLCRHGRDVTKAKRGNGGGAEIAHPDEKARGFLGIAGTGCR